MSHIQKLVNASRRTVTLPHCGWTLRLLRANAYDFLATGIPLGSLLQKLSRATAHLVKAEEIPDDLAAELNRDAPSHTRMCELLLIHCVNAMKLSDADWEEHWQEYWQEDHPEKSLPDVMPEQEWKRVKIVPDDAPEEDMGEDAITVDGFVRSMDSVDLGTLQEQIWELNGLGEVVGNVLQPFCGGGGTAPVPDGAGVPGAPDRALEA